MDSIGGLSLFAWQVNLLAIIIGVVVLSSSGMIFKNIQVILEVSVGIGCVLIGTLIMIRKHRANNTNIARSKEIKQQLTNILLNMGTAMISIALTVFALEGPQLSREHEALWPLIVFYILASAIVLYLVGIVVMYIVATLRIGVLNAILYFL